MIGILGDSNQEHGEVLVEEGRGRGRRAKQIAAGALVFVLLAIVLGLAFYPVLAQVLKAAMRPNPSGKDLLALYSIPATDQPGLIQPTGVAVSDDGRVYVADAGAREVRVYDTAGRQLLAFGSLKDGARTHLEVPVHVALGPGSQVFVTDRQLHNIYVFDRDGKYVSRFIPPSRDWAPLGIFVDETGAAYVTDIGNEQGHRVRLFNPFGMEISEFGRTREVKSVKDAQGSFYYPDRAVPYGDHIFVSDSNNGRIQVFDRSGHFQYLIPTGGVPRGLAFDRVGHLVVVDALGSSVDVYAQSGTKLSSIGSDGAFMFPNDVAIDGDGRIFVADRGSRSVQVWGTVAQAPAQGAARSNVRWEWFLLLIPLAVMVPVLFVRPRREDREQAREVVA